MAYTDIDNPELFFQAKTFSGNAGTNAITLDGSEDMQPDWVWLKKRNGTANHHLVDSVRGAGRYLYSNLANAEGGDGTGLLTSFNSNGFTLDAGADSNGSGATGVSWNWKASGSAPAITYTVKVVSDSGNKYRFDDFGTSAVTLDLQEGGTYTFDQSDSSNSGHPLRFSTTSDGSHGGGSEYTTGVTTTGTPGSAGAKTVITVASGTATLYYYCSVHSGMGGQANTNSTFGSSNFSGSVQTKVSANTTAGFSIVSWTGTGSAGTIGHGGIGTPKMIIVKRRDSADTWWTFNSNLGSNDAYVALNETLASNTAGGSGLWNSTAPTSSVFSVGTNTGVNGSSGTYVAYCFAEKKGYSKFGSYTGNGNADGTFIYTGFLPAMVIIKRTDTAGYEWRIVDNKRLGYNGASYSLNPNDNTSEGTSDRLDFVSNGIKLTSSATSFNASGGTYIYMAFAESPFVNSNGVPNNAR